MTIDATTIDADVPFRNCSPKAERNARCTAMADAAPAHLVTLDGAAIGAARIYPVSPLHGTAENPNSKPISIVVWQEADQGSINVKATVPTAIKVWADDGQN